MSASAPNVSVRIAPDAAVGERIVPTTASTITIARYRAGRRMTGLWGRRWTLLTGCTASYAARQPLPDELSLLNESVSANCSVNLSVSTDAGDDHA